jgi:GAF domain-containing protein
MVGYDAQPGRTPPADVPLTRAQAVADAVELREGLSGVSRIVAGAQPVSEILRDVAQFAVQAIPGVDGAGVTLLQPFRATRTVQTWAVTAAFVEEIDSAQYEDLDEGPCLSCMQSRRPAVSGSLGSDQRWPRFGGRIARMGVHSVLALPLVVGEQVIGAINSYAYGRDAFSDHAVGLGAQFAAPAAVSVFNAQLLAAARERTQQLHHALTSRAIIDQAIGIIRARSGMSAEDAFDRLTQISQRENVKLHDVASSLVDEAVRRARARAR